MSRVITKSLLCFLILYHVDCSISRTDIYQIRSLPEKGFFGVHKINPPHKTDIEDCFTSSLLKASIELTKPLAIPRENLPKISQNIGGIEIVLSREMEKEKFADWKRESWIKNGLMYYISHFVPCKTSVHSLGSMVGSNNLLIISDQVDWNESKWSLPQFFQVFLSYGYTKSNVRFRYLNYCTNN